MALVFVIVAVGVAAWNWRIRSVEVRGASIVPNTEVRDTILATLQRRWGGIIPRSSVPFLGAASLAKQLQQTYAFQNVHIHRSLNGAVVAEVSEQPIAALVRLDNEKTAFLSEQGESLGEAPQSLIAAFESGVVRNGRPPLVFRLSAAVPPTVGTRVTSPEAIGLLAGAWRALEESRGALAPSFITLRSGVAGVYDLRTMSGATVTVSTAESTTAVQLAKLRAVLENRRSEADRAKIRSIDLRYGDRVYLQ